MGSSCLINTCFRTSTLTHSTNKHTQSCNSSSRNSQIFLFRKCKPLNASFDNLLHFPTCKQAFLLPLTASLAVLLCFTSSANAGILSGYTGMESVPGPQLPKIEFFDRLNGFITKLVVVIFMGFVAWGYQASKPPQPKICGSANGPPVTASRVKLNDGRHLAYTEFGVPKDTAKYKLVYVHGFDSCRHYAVSAITLTPDVIEELGIYIVSFDRPGYGESDPHPNRTLKSLSFDIEELADQLGLGLKFYVIGFSMGGQLVWSCLKYIPHRLAGATLIAPVVNYWWPGFPANLSKEAFYQQFREDQWSMRVAHYLPWLTYWWNTQKWFPSSTLIAWSPAVLSHQDLELVPKVATTKREEYSAQVRQQGEFESLHRDLIIGFGTWEFDPMELKNPFPNDEVRVHLWNGDEDKIVPVTLQRYIAQKLPWINYHEIARAGHMFPYSDGMGNAIIKVLLIGKTSP